MDSKEIYDYIVKVQSIAKIGLKYSTDPYAISNYKEINDLSLRFLEDFLNVKFNRPNYFERNIYPTPNVSVRTVIFNNDKTKVLMVREANEQRFSLPGGWADLYESPSYAASKECIQEAGAMIDIVRLVGILNRLPEKCGNTVPEYVIIFEAKLKGELQEHEYETDLVEWYDINNLPPISKKTNIDEINRIINSAKNGETIFD